jgi:hypothetical protein
MRLNKSWQKLLMVSTVPLAVAALLAGVLPASASVSQAAARGVKVEHAEGCIKLNLIDRITNFYTNANVPPSSVSVGFKSAHFDQLYDSTGSTVVGSAVGTVDITNQLPCGPVAVSRRNSLGRRRLQPHFCGCPAMAERSDQGDKRPVPGDAWRL